MPLTPLVVLGSANRDLTILVARHPRPGETLLGGTVVTGLGGKGANQAAAAARSGGHPVFVSAVGDDSTGRDMLSELAAVGVDTSHVAVVAGEPTGVALITVSADGENTIVVAPGANATLAAETTADTVSSLVGPGSVLLAQLEVPLAAVRAAALAASAAGARVVLNVSPYQALPADLLAVCDPLLVNESEAALLSGLPTESATDARAAALALQQASPSVVLTLGGDGVIVAEGSGVTHAPSRTVPVVDTTGAGDAFAGALAAALASGASLGVAVQAGIEAGALAVQHLGAQPPAGFVGV